MNKTNKSSAAANSAKRKGGAEKLRLKKKKRLEEEAKKCYTLNEMLQLKLKENTVKNNKENDQCGQDVAAGPSGLISQYQNFPEQETIFIEQEQPNETPPGFSGLVAPAPATDIEQEATADFAEYNFFSKPNFDELHLFFNYHPKKPNKPICLAFSHISKESAFKNGFREWKHVHQRIFEHENSSLHKNSCESYFMYQKEKNIDTLIIRGYHDKRTSEVMKNRQILGRVIDVIKIIGKRGLAYRSHLNEAAYSLSDETYDIILKGHLDKIIAQSTKYKEMGARKRQGNFLTFLSKSTLNYIITIIASSIKEEICKEISIAGMFSIEVDTTQDISVTDQCSLIIRYVYNEIVHERFWL
ncbi:unnamed protein product [Ceutorhynchus assimilis]|uniref:DUF4371 domain-containing protein n=1 Tax=Ceutorhynchus assimilis TaxID=467358 RepID=A0A9N9MXN7_9CUCU|nr:unnamed protein product [Ceutorhynchus assimilis]